MRMLSGFSLVAPFSAVRAAFATPRVSQVAMAAGLAAASGLAAADGIDVSDAVTAISAAVTTVSTLGVAALSVIVAVRVFKWVRGAL